MRSTPFGRFFSLACLGLAARTVEALHVGAPVVQTFPSAAVEGPITSQWISTSNYLDAPKLSAVNATSGQWWYFDVVSNANESVIVVFFASTNASFPALGPVDGVDTVTVEGTFANGTIWGYEFTASEAVVTSVGNGASGVWKGTGTSFTGTPDLSRYSIAINSHAAGIKGSITFDAVGLALAFCNFPTC